MSAADPFALCLAIEADSASVNSRAGTMKRTMMKTTRMTTRL